MKNGTYETRKEQIEKDFLRRIVREFKADGITVTPRLRKVIAVELKMAAMVGALYTCANTRKFIDGHIQREIERRGALDVLGYGDEKGGR